MFSVVVLNRILRKKKVIFQTRINDIIFEDNLFDEGPFKTIPFDADREPHSLGDKNPIFFKVFPLDIIQGPKQESYLFFIFLKFNLSLLNQFEVSKNEPNKESNTSLVDSLSARSLDNRVIDGKAKLQGREESEGPNG